MALLNSPVLDLLKAVSGTPCKGTCSFNTDGTSCRSQVRMFAYIFMRMQLSENMTAYIQ